MTVLGRILGLFAVAGLLWVAMIAAVAALLSNGADFIIGFGLLAALLVVLAIALLAFMVREGRGVEL